MRRLQATMSIQRHPTLVRPCARDGFALNLASPWTWQNPLRLHADRGPTSCQSLFVPSPFPQRLEVMVHGLWDMFSDRAERLPRARSKQKRGGWAPPIKRKLDHPVIG